MPISAVARAAVMARDRASHPTGPPEAAAGSPPGHALAIRGEERPADLKAEVSAPVRASVVVLALGVAAAENARADLDRFRIEPPIRMSLTGKTGLIVGVANKRSIAWAIAQAAAAAGARLAVTYQGERLEENVRELSAGLQDPLLLPCDVTDDAQIAAVFEGIDREFGGLDFLVHGVAFARPHELSAPFVDTTREGSGCRSTSAPTP